MRLKLLTILIVLLANATVAIAQEDSYYDLVENKGQWPSQVAYGLDVENGKVFIERSAFTYHFFDLSAISEIHGTNRFPEVGTPRIKGHVFKQNFISSNNTSNHYGKKIQHAKYSFYLGNDASKHAGGCRSYGDIVMSDYYNGIDLHYYNQDLTLKYDWIVKPGADASAIQWSYEGAENARIEDSRILIQTSVFNFYESKPIAYQFVNGERRYVECRFVKTERTFGFEFPNGYDTSLELIIDPILIFSTYSGSFSDNFGYTATYDSEGNLISGSSAFGQGYPTTTGAYQTMWGGGDGGNLPGTDMAISKYDASGSFMHWSTFLGGANDELPHSLICNANDEVLVYGTTSSPAFPVTIGALDTSFNGGNAFAPQGVGTDYVNGSDIVVTIISQDGSDLVASTFLGGTSNDGVNTSSVLKFNYADEFRGEIDLDQEGNILIASSTYSANFPIVNGAQNIIGGNLDACFVKLAPNLSSIVWSTFYGGSGDDTGNSVSIDTDGDVYMCGGTTSSNLPMNGAALYNTNQGGVSDGWIVKWPANGGSLLKATYLGANEYDQLYFVEVDSEDLVHVYGQTLADDDYFVINAGWSEPNSGMLVSKIDANLQNFIWSTVFGTGEGKCNLSPAAFTVDVCGKVYLSGWGGSTNTSTNPNTDNTLGMTTTPDAIQTATNGGDFYLLVITDDASSLVYASFFGGLTSQEHVDGGTSRFDRRGIIYQSVCAGCGSNDDFPIFPPGAVVSATNNSFNCNNGVFKFDFQEPLTIADFIVPPVVCVGQTFPVQNLSQFGQSFEWDFAGEFSSNAFEPNYTFNEPGEYEITLLVSSPNTCNGQDSIAKYIEVVSPSVSSIESVVSCNGDLVELGPSQNPNGDSYQWTPSLYLSDPNDVNPTFTPGVNTDYILLIHHGACVDTLFQSVEVTNVSIEPIADLLLCEEGGVTLDAVVLPIDAAMQWSFMPNFSSLINTSPNDYSVDINIINPVTVYVLAEVNGCEAQTSVDINLVAAQTAIEGDFTACAGDVVSLNIVSPNPNFDYVWYPADLILDGQGTSEVMVLVESTTTFGVTSETPEGCEATDEVVVSVSNLEQVGVQAFAEPNIIIEGQTVQLLAQPSGYTYSWSPASMVSNATIYNPVSSPSSTTDYIVIVHDGECSVSDTVRVTVVDFVCGPPSIYVPNAFTPNEDNRNEKLFVHANNVNKVNFKIYDRWGELVFEGNSLSEGWDGYYKDKLVDPAVFVYYLEVTCAGGQTFFDKGNITVIR
ncbi:MAG: gliding motility-associated C-terminal domain-containing protein [Flavobacteriales bacterium]